MDCSNVEEDNILQTEFPGVLPLRTPLIVCLLPHYMYHHSDLASHAALGEAKYTGFHHDPSYSGFPTGVSSSPCDLSSMQPPNSVLSRSSIQVMGANRCTTLDRQCSDYGTSISWQKKKLELDPLCCRCAGVLEVPSPDYFQLCLFHVS